MQFKYIPIIYWTLFTICSACGEKPPISFVESPPKPDNLGDADASATIAKQWIAGEAIEQTISIDTGFGLVSQALTLAQVPNTEESLMQINRPINTVTAYQGHDGDEITETFAVSEAGLMDLLIIIDDSDSMDGYQQKIANSLPSILKHVGNTNWRIAVATTSDPCLRSTSGGTQILSRDFYNADAIAGQAAFRELIDVGLGSSWERGIQMAADALEGLCGATTVPWTRPQAQVSVLLVTDEENCGSASNENCDGEEWENPSYLTDKFGPDPVVHGLLLLQDPPPGSDSSCDNSGYYDDPPDPSSYIDLITTTGGIYDDICTSDYEVVLEDISQSVSDKINVQFELTYTPSGSLEIEIDGQAVASYFTDQNVLTVDPSDVPDGAVSISIKYKHTPVSKTRYYSANMGVDESTLNVMVNDVLADPSLYEYRSNTRQVVFNDLPANRSKIDLVFRENISLKTEFIFSQSFITDSLKVYINGVQTDAFTVDMPSRNLTLAEAPWDNSEVMLVYERSSDKTLEYDIKGVNPGQLEEFTIRDASSGEEIPASINLSNQLEFDRNDVYQGRKIIAIYNLQFGAEQRRFQLPITDEMLPDSLVIRADGEAETCEQEIEINNEALNFYCSDEDFEVIEVSYTEAKEMLNTFTLDFDYAGPVRWVVYVDGKEFDKFHLFDKTVVILNKNLPIGSTVRVEVHPITDAS